MMIYLLCKASTTLYLCPYTRYNYMVINAFGPWKLLIDCLHVIGLQVTGHTALQHYRWSTPCPRRSLIRILIPTKAAFRHQGSYITTQQPVSLLPLLFITSRPTNSCTERVSLRRHNFIFNIRISSSSSSRHAAWRQGSQTYLQYHLRRMWNSNISYLELRKMTSTVMTMMTMKMTMMFCRRMPPIIRWTVSSRMRPVVMATSPRAAGQQATSCALLNISSSNRRQRRRKSGECCSRRHKLTSWSDVSASSATCRLPKENTLPIYCAWRPLRWVINI